MEEKKLNSLISMLFKMAIEQENPYKYNEVIKTLLRTEGISNFNLIEHRGGPVLSYVNSEGGVSLIGE